MGGTGGGGYDGDEANYTVAVSADCKKVVFYHWNTDMPTSNVNHVEYFFEGKLYPGDWIVANVRVYVPYGVAAGDVNPGVLTVIAQSTSGT